MNEEDIEVRNRTYAAFLELGRAPTPDEIGDRREVLEAWRRLHDAHALVLNPATDELRMANPLSAVPTAYRVNADDRWWYGNCASRYIGPERTAPSRPRFASASASPWRGPNPARQSRRSACGAPNGPRYTGTPTTPSSDYAA